MFIPRKTVHLCLAVDSPGTLHMYFPVRSGYLQKDSLTSGISLAFLFHEQCVIWHD